MTSKTFKLYKQTTTLSLSGSELDRKEVSIECDDIEEGKKIFTELWNEQ
jgi:hypothetical protein